MNTIAFLTAAASAGIIAGCAPTVPFELVNARFSYSTASGGPAGRLVPAELHKAHVALDKAEESFKTDADGYQTRDLAYVAVRKTEMAVALATIAEERDAKKQSNKDFRTEQTEIMKSTKRQLSDTRKELTASDAGGEQARKDLATSEQSGDKARAELATSEAGAEQTRKDLAVSEKTGEKAAGDLSVERAARLAAEKLASDALAALAKLGEIKQEERGLVITLSGSVLFASDKATLLPNAQLRLNQVAEALLYTRERNLLVEGHTDSVGTAAYNLDLSQRRADAVRGYLMVRGYDATRILARGIGKVRPVANNSTAEGRANNRRVEIIVQRLASL